MGLAIQSLQDSRSQEDSAYDLAVWIQDHRNTQRNMFLKERKVSALGLSKKRDIKKPN